MIPALALLGALGQHPETVRDYPDRVQPFDYEVTMGIPHNASKSGDTDASRMQSIEERNAALNKYLRPGQSPAERAIAIRMGKIEADRLKQFWTEDTHPRRHLGISSSGVSGVRLMPGNRIAVQFGGKGKWYTYRGGANSYDTSVEASRLVNSPSIDDALRGWWGKSHRI